MRHPSKKAKKPAPKAPEPARARNKPISLAPLSFVQAVDALLKVKPRKPAKS